MYIIAALFEADMHQMSAHAQIDPHPAMFIYDKTHRLSGALLQRVLNITAVNEMHCVVLIALYKASDTQAMVARQLGFKGRTRAGRQFNPRLRC